MDLLDVPVIVQLPRTIKLEEESHEWCQSFDWRPDQAGGRHWLVESFLLRFPDYRAIYADDFIVLTEKPFEHDLSMIIFEKYSELLCFAEGTILQWGIYFAKYFNCSLLTNFLDLQAPIKIVMRPEDKLEFVLENWEFESERFSCEMKRLSPRLISLNCLAAEA